MYARDHAWRSYLNTYMSIITPRPIRLMCWIRRSHVLQEYSMLCHHEKPRPPSPGEENVHIKCYFQRRGVMERARRRARAESTAAAWRRTFERSCRDPADRDVSDYEEDRDFRASSASFVTLARPMGYPGTRYTSGCTHGYFGREFVIPEIFYFHARVVRL